MALKGSPISCPNATRDVAIDLTKALETSEVVTGTPTAVSSDSDFLVTSNVIRNPVILTKEDGKKVAAYKGVQWGIATTTAGVYADFDAFPTTGAISTWYFASDSGIMYTWDVDPDVLAYEAVTVPKTVSVDLWFQGDSGTADRYEIIYPLKSPALTR